MVLGQGHPALEPVAVDRQQQLDEHGLGALVEVADVIAVAGHDHQVGQLLQGQAGAIGLHQRDQVLAQIGP